MEPTRRASAFIVTSVDDIASVRRIPGQFFIEDPILDNGDEANEPDDVERDPDITISDDEADDYENENDDFNVEPEDLAELEDSGNANDDDSDDDDWGTNNRREPVDAVPITELESRPLEIGAGCEDRHGDRMLNLRQIVRKKKCTKAISMRKMRMKMRDRERDDAGTINNSAPSRKKKKKKKKKGRTREKEGTSVNASYFCHGPRQRSEQCFSWLSREFQGYGCYVPQLGDSVMYIPHGHEEFFDALNDTVSYRVWDDKADVRFCEPCVVSNCGISLTQVPEIPLPMPQTRRFVNSCCDLLTREAQILAKNILAETSKIVSSRLYRLYG